MRHGDKLRKLSRDSASRMALFRNLVDNLIVHGRIKTTVPRAKELRKFADWVVTCGKKAAGHEAMGLKPNPNALVSAQQFLRTKEAMEVLVKDLAPRYLNRPGGYTRVMRVGHRRGDAADMAIIEYVDCPGEVRPAGAVDLDTVKRNWTTGVPTFRDLLPSRNFRADTFIHSFTPFHKTAAGVAKADAAAATEASKPAAASKPATASKPAAASKPATAPKPAAPPSAPAAKAGATPKAAGKR
jgi:large subunit ribosomal protein L17